MAQMTMENGRVREMTSEEEVALEAQRALDAASHASQVPPLTRRQLRMGLVLNGIALDQVDAALAGIEDPQGREIAKIEWEDAMQFERSHPLLQQVGTALGLVDAQIDAMWMQAATL